MLEESTGIVLKSTPFRDTSIITRVFTREFGKISLLAKGVRKSKQGNAGILESMNHINFHINYNSDKDLQIFRDLTLISSLTKIRANYERLISGLAMVDMIDKTIQVNDASIILFRLLRQTLIELNNPKSNIIYLYLFFQFQLAKFSGFNPLPDQCQKCLKELFECYLNKKNGNQYCSSCILDESIYISKFCCEFLNLLSKTYISEIQTINIQKDELQRVKNYLNCFLNFHLNGIDKAKSLQLIL